MKPHTIYIVVAHDDEKVWEGAITPILSSKRLGILTPDFTALVDHLTTEKAALFGFITTQPVIYVLTDDGSVTDEVLAENMGQLRTIKKQGKIILRVTEQNENKAQRAADAVVEIAKQGTLAATVMAVAKKFAPPE